MLLTSFLKTSLIDKHGTLLPKAMRRLNSMHLQVFHNTFEHYSALSRCAFRGVGDINRKNECTVPRSRISTIQEYSTENNRNRLFSFMDSTKSLFKTGSSAFHTSPISHIFTSLVDKTSFNGKIRGTSRQRRSLVEQENEEIDEESDIYNSEMQYIKQRGKHHSGSTASQKVNRHDSYSDNNHIGRNTDLRRERQARKNVTNTGRTHSNRQIQSHLESEDSATDGSDVSFDYGKMEKAFPDPRSALNRIYTIVSAELKEPKYMVRPSFEEIDSNKKLRAWECTYKVLWPTDISFSAIARSKSVAGNSAALKCLHYLLVNGKIKNGIPLVYGSDEIKDILNKPTQIQIQPEDFAKVNKLLDWYKKDIMPLLTRSENGLDETVQQLNPPDNREDIYEEQDSEILPMVNEMSLPTGTLTDPLRGTPLVQHNTAALRKRDMDMYHNLQERDFNTHNNLPIMEYREDIINQLQDERVLVVKGEPGCGKSTQLPQFILDDFSKRGKGTECNMIITQPRRISAISLAKRVAEERNEELGDSIGYQVRLQSVLPSGPSGGILFCSTGILLRRLQSNPSLIGCSHVVLDEAHERDLNTDILIVLLNRALQKNPNLKLIIMSATINAGLFERYFNCNTISVPGFTYPVKMHFLEDMIKLHVPGITDQDMSLPNPSINTEQIADLISWISNRKPRGAILCFLPGWSEIQKLKRILEETLPLRSHLILPVHSRLPYSEQSLIFNRAPDGVRKVILATNIAETSITINDVVYVVDSCAHKEVRLQHDTGRSSIDNQWVSQGNINQRKGRAGRVQPGESYHFITRDKYKSLEEFPTPEIMRAELQKAVLDCKTYTTEKAAEFFAQMPEPPRISSVEFAVTELIEIGALNENEDLTALGKRIALFPIDPRLSKVMVYSAIFQCVNPIITLTSILSSDFEIFADRLYDKSPIRRLKHRFHPESDHLALSWLFEQWNVHLDKSQREAQQFCRNAQLQFGKMMILKDLRNLYSQHLSQCRMMDTYERWDDLNSRLNKFASHDEIVRGVLLAGLDKVLQKKDGEFKNGRFKKVKNVMHMQDGHRGTLTPDSVNYNREKWPSPYLTYQRHVHSTERRTTLIRETSLVSPLTVLLFSQGNVTTQKHRQNDAETNNVILGFQGKKNVRILCNAETAKTLLELRDSLHNIARFFIENQGLVSVGENILEIQSFKENLIQLLTDIMNDSSNQIDYAESEIESEDDFSL